MHYNVYMLVYVNFLVAKKQIQSGEAGGGKRKVKLPFGERQHHAALCMWCTLHGAHAMQHALHSKAALRE